MAVKRKAKDKPSKKIPVLIECSISVTSPHLAKTQELASVLEEITRHLRIKISDILSSDAAIKLTVKIKCLVGDSSLLPKNHP